MEKRSIEISGRVPLSVSLGCSLCGRPRALVRSVVRTCMRSRRGRAGPRLRIRTVPAVVVDGPPGCCRNTGPTREELSAAGIGSALTSNIPTGVSGEGQRPHGGGGAAAPVALVLARPPSSSSSRPS